MPEIIFNGPEGRLEGRYVQKATEGKPMAMILHPLPQLGGNMNNPVTYQLYQTFLNRGFTVLRFNFRGVGKSQGTFDHGVGELSDAASALDWLQSFNPDAKQCWLAGYSFGAWIGMQLLMRRPEITGFICLSPPAATHDFTFLAPCPASGLIIQGAENETVPPSRVRALVDKISKQKGVTIDIDTIKGANNFFSTHLDEAMLSVANYLDRTDKEQNMPNSISDG